MKLKELINAFFGKEKNTITSRNSKAGSYSIATGVIFLAILVVINMLFASLPSSWTSFDISSAQLYSLSSNSKAVVKNNDKDVTIYWLSQEKAKDTVIEKLLAQYTSLSSHIEVIDKDPDVYPTFASQYTSDTVNNNSLIVECGDKFRYIDYYDIYVYDTSSYYTTGSVSASFDGEGAITSAIDYVISDELPMLYLLTGHGEQDLSDSFAEMLEKENIETSSFSLLNVDAVPEDADCVVIYAPQSDLSVEEVDMLKDYVKAGGKLLVMNGLKENAAMSNLNQFLAAYDVTVHDGLVIENDRNVYVFYPYVLLSTIAEHDITTPISENNHYVIVPITSGLTIGSPDNATVSALLSSSENAYVKASGYQLTTYDLEENDLLGQFALAVAIDDSTNDGKAVWVASDYLLNDTYNSYSSGGNLDFVMNSISWMIGESEAISIRSKSLDYATLTISESQASYIKIVLLAGVPGLYLLYGIDEVIKRRKK